MFCEQCGKQISEAGKYCRYCGHKTQELKQEVSVDKQKDEISKQKQKIDNIKYAGFWIRFFAYLIDGFVILVLLAVLYLILPKIFDDYTLFIILYIFLIWAYFIYFEGKSGSTIGKKLLGIKVLSKDLKPINYNIAFIRTLGKIPSSILFLGYIAIALNKNKLGWHDKIAKTVVIYERKKAKSKKFEDKKVKNKKNTKKSTSTIIATRILYSVLILLLLFLSILGAIGAFTEKGNGNQNSNKTSITNRVINPMPDHLIIMDPLFKIDSSGEYQCKRFGEIGFMPEDYLAEKEIEIRGYFAGTSLSVNDIDIELKGTKFDTNIEFDFKSGKNRLIFKGIYPTGREEIRECYMEYRP
ncbi:MAG: RDD family protein [Patescibacteria group bacterium]|nr:RDD family protein [Patescibacteria group bacterium]